MEGISIKGRGDGWQGEGHHRPGARGATRRAMGSSASLATARHVGQRLDHDPCQAQAGAHQHEAGPVVGDEAKGGAHAAASWRCAISTMSAGSQPHMDLIARVNDAASKGEEHEHC